MKIPITLACGLHDRTFTPAADEGATVDEFDANLPVLKLRRTTDKSPGEQLRSAV